MEVIKTQVTCARPSPWEPIQSWLEDLLPDVRKAQVSLSTKTEDLLRCIEEWLDVIFYSNLVGANISKMDKTGGNLNPQTFSAEGVEGYIPFTGPLKFVLQGYASGIRSGMSYTGACSLKELRLKAKFVQITNSGFKESNVHGISKFD
jgi:hypothetical protein